MSKSRTPTPPILSPPPDVDSGREENTPPLPENCTDLPAVDLPCTSSSQSVIWSPEEQPLITSTLFPLHSTEVNRFSQTAEEQAALPENLEATMNGDAEPNVSLMEVDQPDNSSDSNTADIPPVNESPGESQSNVLQCEFCGKKGCAHSFLRSKRFCSMTCVRRLNVRSMQRLGLLRADRASRWPQRPMGRRGRPPGCVVGTSREHFLRQLPARLGEKYAEDEPPGPMTTRLRHQAERERKKKQKRKQRWREASDINDLSAPVPNPSQWTVDQVCTYISCIPGCTELAEEFRCQEIDGQALLLLTEDHLVSTMNIKLGPALKICAQINMLKGP